MRVYKAGSCWSFDLKCSKLDVIIRASYSFVQLCWMQCSLKMFTVSCTRKYRSSILLKISIRSYLHSGSKCNRQLVSLRRQKVKGLPSVNQTTYLKFFWCYNSAIRIFLGSPMASRDPVTKSTIEKSINHRSTLFYVNSIMLSAVRSIPFYPQRENELEWTKSSFLRYLGNGRKIKYCNANLQLYAMRRANLVLIKKKKRLLRINSFFLYT